jgi:hypothetical protein
MKKKITFAKFTDSGRRQTKGANRKYAKGLSSYEKRVKKVKEIAGDCWWLKNYLMGSCGLQQEPKKKLRR